MANHCKFFEVKCIYEVDSVLTIATISPERIVSFEKGSVAETSQIQPTVRNPAARRVGTTRS